MNLEFKSISSTEIPTLLHTSSTTETHFNPKTSNFTLKREIQFISYEDTDVLSTDVNSVGHASSKSSYEIAIAEAWSEVVHQRYHTGRPDKMVVLLLGAAADPVVSELLEKIAKRDYSDNEGQQAKEEGGKLKLELTSKGLGTNKFRKATVKSEDGARNKILQWMGDIMGESVFMS